MRVGGLVLIVVASLVMAAQAQAQVPPAVHVYFNAAGEPVLYGYAENGRPPVLEWRTCPPDGGACEPLPESAYQRWCLSRYTPAYCQTSPRPLDAEPGAVPAGTTFEALYESGGVQKTARTPAWTGPMTPVSPPALVGDLVVGGSYQLRRATWTGGWAPSTSVHENGGAGLYACPTPQGGQCWAVISGLERRWAGWYLFVNDMRWGGRPFESTVAGTIWTLPRNFEWTPGIRPTSVGSAPYGPVCCVTPAAARQPVVEPPAASRPLVTIRARAVRRAGRLVVGRAACATRCTLQLTVVGGGRKAIRRTLRVTGARDLVVPARRGRLSVRVVVDGKLIASGTAVAR